MHTIFSSVHFSHTPQYSSSGSNVFPQSRLHLTASTPLYLRPFLFDFASKYATRWLALSSNFSNFFWICLQSPKFEESMVSANVVVKCLPLFSFIITDMCPVVASLGWCSHSFVGLQNVCLFFCYLLLCIHHYTLHGKLVLHYLLLVLHAVGKNKKCRQSEWVSVYL